MDRTILHIDFDSFFASVEQQYNARLRGKPVGVTATNGRTCIIASSREAKVLGIKTGSRTYDARKICPSIIFVPADFVKYFEVSKKFLDICKDYSPFVELFSIDELFIDISPTMHLFGGRKKIVEAIKKRIKEEIGEYITASIGISYSKLLAKLASGIKKPDGVFEINKNNLNEVYRKAKLTDMCGIGERIKIRLNTIGVYNLLELRETPIHILEKEFGNAYSNILKNIGMARDDTPIVPYTDPVEVKSVGRNYCLPKNEYDKRVVLQNLFELCEEVGIKLRRLNKKSRTVGVSLRGNISIGGRKTYSVHMDRGSEIFRSCLIILRTSEASREVFSVNSSRPTPLSGVRSNNKEYVRQISVWVSNLENKKNIQQSLFHNKRRDRLQQTIDSLNERFGDHTIRNAFLLYADKLTTVPNGYMADKYERTRLANESIGL